MVECALLLYNQRKRGACALANLWKCWWRWCVRLLVLKLVIVVVVSGGCNEEPGGPYELRCLCDMGVEVGDGFEVRVALN